jgi:uncharacterized protein (DUF1015 family)
MALAGQCRYGVPMPRFEPFRALRYRPDADLQAVIAPPYDVLSAEEVVELQRLDPRNIAWIDVPTGEDDEKYQNAATALAAWINDGTLILDEVPALTIYRMRFTDATGVEREISGVLGGLEVVDADAGGVLPHERVTPKASTDRLDLTRATRTNMSPVWGLSLASGLTAALAAPGEPVGDMTFDGVQHIVERITDPERISEISRIIGTDDVLIADGHHRYGVARQYRDETDHSAAEFTLAFVNELAPEQLSIEAIHRLYSGVCEDELRGYLGRYFEFSPADEPTPAMLGQMVETGRLVMLWPDGRVEWLTPKPGAFDGVRALDGAWLERATGFDGTGTRMNGEVSYQHGLAETVDAVRNSGEYTAGILIRPTSIEEIIRTAREHLLMPPKSTFFTPKLRTGLVLRPMD